MAGDYIRREDARRMVVQLDKYAWKSPVSDERRVTVDVDLVKFGLDRIPAADVAPVRHGRWICIRKGYGEYECSVCHGVDSDCSDYYGTHVVTEQDYCPNCGSRMDGDDDE